MLNEESLDRRASDTPMPQEDTGDRPDLSVVIPALREARNLAVCYRR